MKIDRFTILFMIVMSLVGAPVLAEDAKVNIFVRGRYRHIESNGIPNHNHGQFPNRFNPNFIQAQNYQFRIAVDPQVNTKSRPLEGFLFGVATSGIPFDPGTAEYYNNDRSSGWNVEALARNSNLDIDQNKAHVQPNGAYHYHGAPHDIIHIDKQTNHSNLIGYAADGFPIYAFRGFLPAQDPSQRAKMLKSSYRIKTGTRPSGPSGSYDGTYVNDYEYVANNGDLDECNGRVGITPEYPQGTYHYFLTADYPYVPRCFKGNPDASFKKAKPRHPPTKRLHAISMGMRPFSGDPDMKDTPPRMPPKIAMQACAGKNTGEACQFKDPPGRVNGICRFITEKFACVPFRP